MGFAIVGAGLLATNQVGLNVSPVAYNYGFYGGGSTLAIETGAGPGGAPHVRVVNPSNPNGADIGAPTGFYGLDPNFRGGIFVARGDVNGTDGTGEIVVGGNGLIGIRNANGTAAAANFAPFGNGYGGEVRVAVADLNGDGTSEIIAAAGPGGGPHVRAFNANGTPFSGSPANGFYAYGSDYTGGVFVAAADLNADGNAEIITGTGQGGGPHVRAFSANGTPFALTGQGDTDGRGFYAYDANFMGGVRVAAGYFDNSGRALLVLGAGVGGGPHVRIMKGVTASTLPAGLPSNGWYAFDPNFTRGVFVGAGDIDADEDAEVVVGAGAGGSSHVRAFDETGTPVPGVVGSPGFYAYPNGCPGTATPDASKCFTGGVTVAAGKV